MLYNDKRSRRFIVSPVPLRYAFQCRNNSDAIRSFFAADLSWLKPRYAGAMNFLPATIVAGHLPGVISTFGLRCVLFSYLDLSCSQMLIAGVIVSLVGGPSFIGPCVRASSYNIYICMLPFILLLVFGEGIMSVICE